MQRAPREELYLIYDRLPDPDEPISETELARELRAAAKLLVYIANRLEWSEREGFDNEVVAQAALDASYALVDSSETVTDCLLSEYWAVTDVHRTAEGTTSVRSALDFLNDHVPDHVAVTAKVPLYLYLHLTVLARRAELTTPSNAAL